MISIKHASLPGDTEIVLEGKKVQFWNLLDDERDRLTKYFPRDKLKLVGTYLLQQRIECEGCGKPTEFIDFVYTAAESGIHTPEFMERSFGKQKPLNSPPHTVKCSKCGSPQPVAFGWATGESFVWDKENHG